MDNAAKLKKAIYKIRCIYEPADSFEDADLIMKTSQVLDEIKAHFSDWTIDTQEFFQEFERVGYKYEVLPENIEFVWLLKRK